MPPKTTTPDSRTATENETSESEAENARAEITALFQKMQRAAAEKRRKKRDDIEAAYASEISHAEACILSAMDSGEQEADYRRMLVLEKFEDALRRRREIEARIATELASMHEAVTGTLQSVESAVAEVDALVGEKEVA